MDDGRQAKSFRDQLGADAPPCIIVANGYSCVFDAAPQQVVQYLVTAQDLRTSERLAAAVFHLIDKSVHRVFRTYTDCIRKNAGMPASSHNDDLRQFNLCNRARNAFGTMARYQAASRSAVAAPTSCVSRCMARRS